MHMLIRGKHGNIHPSQKPRRVLYPYNTDDMHKKTIYLMKFILTVL
jgi:hypothetical protein